MISNKAPPIVSSTLLSTTPKKKKKKKICGTLLLGVKKVVYENFTNFEVTNKIGPIRGHITLCDPQKRAPDLTVLRGQKRTKKKEEEETGVKFSQHAN
jgi:hypothetical protein